jgi:opacity protein-like surface antigen
MGTKTIGTAQVDKTNSVRGIIVVAVTVSAVCFFFGTVLADTTWTPYMGLSAAYDDNIEFVSTNEMDDYLYLVRPGLKLEHIQEIARIDAEGDVLVRRYQDNDQFDDEIYNLRLNAKSDLSERLSLSGSYRFIKDTTLDSELKEVGRIFVREDRNSHLVGLAPKFDLTERLNIGLEGRYRDVAYDSDTFVDYSVKNINLPVSWLLTTEVDTIYVNPGFTDRDSDTTRSKTYNLRLGWKHKPTERLNLDLSLGARYTELEEYIKFEEDDSVTTKKSESWSGVGSLQLGYRFQTGQITIDLKRDLAITAVGEQADVTRVRAHLEQAFSERFGMQINGSYYRTINEGENQSRRTELMEAGSELFYKFTESHDVYIGYRYSQEEDESSGTLRDSSAKRNVINAGVRLRFPIQ